MTKRDRTSGSLLHDIVLIAVSVYAALVLVQTGMISQLLSSMYEGELLASFIAGLFFTSVFTTAPAIVALGEISRLYEIVPVALVGALGAVVGDALIFHFVRDRFSEHLLQLVSHRSTVRRLHSLVRLKLFRFVSFVVGGLIIASPLPDELGIGLLGFSKMQMIWFIPLSFVCNFIGIVLIGLVARAV